MGRSKSNDSPPVATVSKGGAGCLGIFGLIFALAGLAFTFFTVKDFFKTVDARGWDKVPARLVSAEIAVEQGQEEPFVVRVTFTYPGPGPAEGREWTSNRYALKERRSDNYEKLALELKEFRARKDPVAYVNPENPAEAVLNPGSLGSGFTILFPLIFVAVGVGCIIGAFRIARHGKKKVAGELAISSSPTKKGAGARAGIVVGLIFAAVGLGLLYPLGILPLSRASAAKKWVETPCKIIWAKVKSHSSDDGTTYSVDVFYSYEFDGQVHRSNRYSFVGGSSSGRQPKQEAANRYRKAERPICYVDPKLPERAVLKRDLGAGLLLSLIPLGLLAIGVPVTVGSMRARGKQGEGTAKQGGAGSTSTALRGESSPAQQTYSPGKNRLVSAVVLLLVGLFWNGLVFGFLFREAWLQDGGLFLKLFSIPFIAVGLLIALGFVHTVLALFNPRATVTLEPGEPELGVPARLKWSFNGSTGRLRRLRIVLRGVERASFTRGTDTITEEKIFYAVALADQSQAMAMHRGTAEFTLPHDLMYSLELSNNAIRWQVEVIGEIAFWPDVSDKYDIVVRPYPAHETRNS